MEDLLQQNTSGKLAFQDVILKDQETRIHIHSF